MRRETGRGLMTAAAAGVAALTGYRLFRRLRQADLSGQVALVTGGSRGLGLQIARELAGQGCRLALCARDEQELARAARDVTARGARVLPVACDVSLRDDVEHLVETVESHLGPVDILVNNAGIVQVGPLETMTLEDFEQAMAVNFWGAVYATLAVLPEMRARRRGRIVNITSIGGRVAVPHLLPYDCAKFAFVGFSEGLRVELARDGVRVTTVLPGLMRTGSPVNAAFKGRREAEFAWFGLGNATPLTAMSAERAARRIVRALRQGEAEVTLSWQAKALRLAHDLFPQLTLGALALVNRLLPGAEGAAPGQARGVDLRAFAPSRLGALLARDADRYNQLDGVSSPAAPGSERGPTGSGGSGR